MEKVDKKMANVSKEMETITNNQKAILPLRSTIIIKMKKAFDGLFSIYKMVKERIREVKDMPI